MPRKRIEGQAITRGAADLWRKVTEPGAGAHYRGYIRFSHEAGRFGLTTEGQKEAIVAYGQQRGWVCDGFDEEPARSAKYEDIEQRPVFRRHLEAAERGDFQISLCYMNDRWARNKVVAYVSLSRLRRAGIWWATTDDRWNIDRIEEDGWDVAYSVDVTMNAAYSRKVSDKTRIGKKTRAQMGYHNGDIMYGYQRAIDPPKPDGAPYNWKPPRQALLPHTENFERLRQMGEWAAMGLSDQQIAEQCNARGWLTQTSKAIGPRRKFVGVDDDGQPLYEHEVVGPRPFSKDTIRAILIRHFPREYAPSNGRGTVLAPDGTRIEGQHPAAWPWDLWHRMDEARGQRRGTRHQRRNDARVWPFSGVIICASCGLSLRADGGGSRRGYYRDEASERGVVCALPHERTVRSVRADLVEQQFAETFLAQRMPQNWREQIATVYARRERDTDWESVDLRRRALESERERVKFQHQHGLVSDEQLVSEAQRIQQALETLPVPMQAAVRTTQTIEAGETLAHLTDYWQHATTEERASIVRAMVMPQGLRYDLHAKQIAAITPRGPFLSLLALALPTWPERDGALWRPTLTAQTTAAKRRKRA